MRILCPLLLIAVLPASSPAAEDAVVATVGGEPITAAGVNRLLEKLAGGGPIDPAARTVLQAQVLAEIVDRRLVLAYVRRTATVVTPGQIDAAIKALVEQLQAEKRTLADELAKQGITEADLRRQIAWNLAWPKYLERYATEARLKEYFEAHRREFDGTRRTVSHILLAPPQGAGSGAFDALKNRAEQLREEIVSGKMTFEEAARHYSAGPSREQGGLLGPIARRGAMAESFSRAAFALGVGQISRPVTTRFGVHLIRVDDEQRGDKQLADVREQVEDALARELTRKMADYERVRTPVEFTGHGPYFKPGTRELVVP